MGGGMRLEPEEEPGTPSMDEEPGTLSIYEEDEDPETRERDEGTGGGGIRELSVRMRGIESDVFD